MTAPIAAPRPRFVGALDPMDRISEILFGLIMTLTATGTLSVITADDFQVRTMIAGALGCNLAWGIIDGGIYLLTRFNEEGRKMLLLRQVQNATDHAAARAMIAGALPPHLAALVPAAQLEAMREGLLRVPAPGRPGLTRQDGERAVAIAVLCFVATFPIVIPFMVIDDAWLALRASNAVAVLMLFLCGLAYGACCRLRPWRAGLAMVAVGTALIVVAIALGG